MFPVVMNVGHMCCAKEGLDLGVRQERHRVLYLVLTQLPWRWSVHIRHSTGNGLLGRCGLWLWLRDCVDASGCHAGVLLGSTC